jgi:hypothetical protein
MCKKKNITLKLMGALLAAQKYHVSYKGMATFKTPSNILLIIINQPDHVMFINKERLYEVSNTRFDKDYIVDNVRMWLEDYFVDNGECAYCICLKMVHRLVTCTTCSFMVCKECALDLSIMEYKVSQRLGFTCPICKTFMNNVGKDSEWVIIWLSKFEKLSK